MSRSVGGVVINPNFLSTSVSEETAKMFKKNAVFEIVINSENYDNKRNE